MVVWVMPQGTATDVAMLQPLALTATAAELEAGYVGALATFSHGQLVTCRFRGKRLFSR